MDSFGLTLPAIVSAGLVALIAAVTMGIFASKNQMPVDGKTVLITGASDGLGRSVVRMLAAKGANIILVARNVPRLEQAVEEAKAAAKNPTQRFHYLTADISKPDYARDLVAQAVAWNDGKPLDIVWNVAGTSTPDFWVEAPLSLTRRMMDINFWGAAEMAHAILREWTGPDVPVVPEPKHLIFTASVLAFVPLVGYGPYNPAKAALRSLADTLQQEVELYPQKVKIHIVYPGGISSPGFDRENQTKPEITRIIEEGDPVQTPDEVAHKAIRGLEKGYYCITVAFMGDVLRSLALGGAPRDNWFYDTFMNWIMQFVWFFAVWDILAKIRRFGKKHGHPTNYRRKANSD